MSSSMCEHEVEVEDLTIGLLRGDEAEDARRHLESCVACRRAQVRFVAERALFEERANVAPAPSLVTEPEVIESITTAVLERRRSASVLRFARATMAVAACAAAVFISAWMHEHAASRSNAASRESDVVATTSTSSPALMNTPLDPVAATPGDAEEQTMACAFPMSGSFANAAVSDIARSSALEAPASVGSIADQATCEAPSSSSGSSMISWRVTSSFATP